jgi:monoamine oxidase
VLKERGQIMFQQPIDAVIIGAGAAGLFAADRLNRAGLSFLVLEADDHAGGRVQSRREAGTDLGLVIDEGANLINSTDTLAIGLLNRFAVPYVRRLPRGVDHMHYVLDGKSYDQAAMQHLLFQAGATALGHMAQDQLAWEQDANPDIDSRFIAESIADYLRRIGADRSLLVMLHSFFWSEYGRTLEELNLHVLFDYFQIDLAGRSFRLIPNADEAYTVPGGTEQIIDGLEAASHAHIKYRRRVFQISDRLNDHVMIECHDNEGRTEAYHAKAVLFAAPLHSLGDILVSVSGVRRESLNQARAVTYARGTKLHMKFKRGFRKIYRYPGILLTDSGEQIWPSDIGQGGGGLMTV